VATARADIDEVWQRYRVTGDAPSRDRLLLNYAPLVKYVAGRLGTGVPAHLDDAALVSYGLSGLMGAIEAFDPARDATFESYAISLIRGSIIDELRSLDWVPRSVRSRAQEIERAMVTLDERLERPPTDGELAAEVGIAVDELEEVLAAISRSSVTALDQLRAPFPEREGWKAVADAIGGLPEREKLLISLYYYEELTLPEIADVLRLSTARVAQLHAKAVLRLNAALRAPVDGAPAAAVAPTAGAALGTSPPPLAAEVDLPDDDDPWRWIMAAAG